MKIIIIGAGAAGLMAAHELSKQKHEVIILEARDRIGGRIWPLPEEEFGYPAQGGAEFVHGKAQVTRQLLREAGLTYVPSEGERWTFENGQFSKNENWGQPDHGVLHQKLNKLNQDMPIAEFLEKNFAGDQYQDLRESVLRMVQGFDAADPNRISTFALRDEWLGGNDWEQGRIKEGYGALLNFLRSECQKDRAEIKFNNVVSSIDFTDKEVVIDVHPRYHFDDDAERRRNLFSSAKQISRSDVKSRGDHVPLRDALARNGQSFELLADKVLITVPLSLISSIQFNPPLPTKVAAAGKIGFGNVVNLILSFKTKWWLHARGQNLTRMMFVFSHEQIPTWWTQYPQDRPTLTGWLAGPASEKLHTLSESQILEMGLASLAHIFAVDVDFLTKQLTAFQVTNWSKDPFARGAYSYATPETKAAMEELSKPVSNKIYFAGEALYTGQETATVEGALASGLEAARKIGTSAISIF